MKKILGHNCPSARIDGQMMVLSLTDAITPIVTFIDLSSEKNVNLSVIEMPDGTYALQKSSGTLSKSTSENVAFYDKKGKAVAAMSMVTDALDRSSRNGRAANHSAMGKVWEVFKLVSAITVIVSVILYFFVLQLFISEVRLIPHGQETASSGMDDESRAMLELLGMMAPVAEPNDPLSGLIPSQNAAPEPATDPDAVGVPMSADDFLQNRSRNVLPF